MKKRLILKIYGNVQGVSFRYYANQKARELNLTGWVKNDRGETVSIVSEGEEGNLRSLLDWCYQGPGFSKVDNIDVDWKEYQNEFSLFEIKYNNL